MRLKSCLLLVSLAPWLAIAGASAWRPLDEARNVIILIPDGCGPAMPALARACTGAPLALDSLLAGAVRTVSADALTTDSAAAATAMASGAKTANGMIGVAPPQQKNRFARAATQPPLTPLPTVLEAAQQSGRAVGLVVTCGIAEATPAAFASHCDSRASQAVIMEQLVYQDLDVVMGGGRKLLLPAGREGGGREDGDDLLAVLRARGIQLVDTRDALLQVHTGRLWGVFSGESLAPAQERAPQEPTLAEMTRTAINLLKQNPRGFFLLVEGSQIDWGNHAHDPAYALNEFLAFDGAVREAMHFAAGEGRGTTLVIAAPDHDTGGMTLGNDRRGAAPENLGATLGGMRLTTRALQRNLGDDSSAANVAAQLLAWWGVTLDDEASAAIQTLIAKKVAPAYAIGEVVTRHVTGVGYTTHNHTGVDVPLWSYGPGRPTGLVDNTDLAAAMARAMQVDLAALAGERFVDLGAAFPELKVDEGDAHNPVARIGRAALPLDTDLLLLDGVTNRLAGVTLRIAATGKIFASRDACTRLRALAP